jgi:putative transposase
VKHVLWKGYKVVADDLKYIYRLVTEEELLALDQFAERRDNQYPQISRSWRAYWTNLNTLMTRLKK